MKTVIKILSVVIAITMVLTSSVIFSQAETADPVLTHRKDFDWGTVMHAPGWGPAYSVGNLETQIHQLAEMGGKLLRIDATNNIDALDKAVMLCNAYGIKVLLILYIPGKTFDPNETIDTEDIETYFRTYAKRYDGTNGCGKVDYIQLDNEMDVSIMGWTGASGYGTDISEYKIDSLATITEQVKAGVRGIRNGNPNVKIVINIAYVHYGLLKYFQQNGVDWDITGHDWYSDMFRYGNSNYDPKNRDLNFYNSGKDLYDLFGKPIIICETNMWTNMLNSYLPDDEGYPNNPAIKASMIDGSYWDEFVLCLEDYYNDEHVIGCTIYEFYDELAHQETTWLGEAHFGLMEADENGDFVKPKPIYYRCQKMFGGGTVKKISLEEIKKNPNDKDDDDDESNTSSNSSQTDNGSVIRKEHYTTITPEPIVLTPEPINKEITQTETVNRKVPVYSNKFFTLPIILSFVIGGIALLAGAGALTFILIKKKRSKQSL